MTDEAKVADVLSRMKLCSEDLVDAKTKQQKTMWGIDAKKALDEGFWLINELVVEVHQLRAAMAKKSGQKPPFRNPGDGYQPICAGTPTARPPRER